MTTSTLRRLLETFGIKCGNCGSGGKNDVRFCKLGELLRA